MSTERGKVRTLEAVKASVEAFPVNGDVIEVLHGEAKGYGFLLAHTEGGVVWGRVEGGVLILAPGAEAIFKNETLQEARLFGAHGELHVWRVGDAGFRGRCVREDAGAGAQYAQAFDERRMLLGDHCERQENGFALLADGMQGLRHWAPVTSARTGKWDVRLHVRSYVVEKGSGVLEVAAARLVNVDVMGG